MYAVPVSGGEQKQLTRSTTESTFSIGYFPHDSRILYTRDQGGNENNHIYVLDTDGKEKDLTPGDKLKAQFLGWTQDGKAFYIMTNERDARFFDIYKIDAASFDRKLLYQDTVGYQLGDISNDEKFIAFAKPNTTSDSDIFLYNVATKDMKNITPHQGEVASNPASFDPAVAIPVLPHRRGQRVLVRCAVRPGDRKERDGREGELGHRLHLLLPQRQVSSRRDQRRRAHEDQDLRQRDGQAGRVARLSRRSDHFGQHLPKRETDVVLLHGR